MYERINSLAKIYDERVVVVANKKYKTLNDLASRPVNLGKIGHGTEITGSLLFDTLGIEIERRDFEKLDALEKVKSDEIAALIYLIEDPEEEFQRLSEDDNITLLDIPQTERLLNIYSPSTLTHRDFPGLIDEDTTVSSVSVAVMIASYNWDDATSWRYTKLQKFVDAFVDGFDNLRTTDYEPTWKTVSLSDEIPGITRLSLVDATIERKDLEKQRLAEAAEAEKAAELRQKVIQAREQLAARLSEKLSQVDDPEEFDRLVEQLRKIIGESF